MLGKDSKTEFQFYSSVLKPEIVDLCPPDLYKSTMDRPLLYLYGAGERSNKAG